MASMIASCWWFVFKRKSKPKVGGMSRPPKPVVPLKKVAPPAVPDAGFRHSGSSFGSAGYSSAGEDHVFHDPNRDGYDTDVYGMAGKSPGQFNYPAFTFPGPQYTQVPGSTKASMYYHHQLSLQEDQGIDMTQSPGRDSPGSSGSGSRHSTASLDSGRASGCHLGPPHPRCSLSSSSVGSDQGAPARVERLLLQGVPDQDVLHSWLMDLHFEEYFPLFVSAGYDMHTISRMTPEDLTAIGIKKPNHRKKLKAEIALLSISDGLPDYIPGSLDEWLRLLRLEEYGAALGCQGYATIEDVTQLMWEDLEDIGIVKLGHQKRLMLAIKRVKDLRAGKTFPPPHTPVFTQNQALPSEPATTECDCPRVHTMLKSFHQPWEIETSKHLYFATDIVPIKIRGGRGKSLESLEEGMTGSGGGTSSFVPATPPPSGWRHRSYDDGDITPTNEIIPLHEGGGTLPRPRGLVRPRPIAKIPATFCPAYRPEDVMINVGTLKRLPPSPPKRQSESVTIVADLHCPSPPAPAPQPPSNWSTESQLIASLVANGSDASFKSSSSTESDSLPFANENAGTIKQRAVRSVTDYVSPIRVQPPTSDTSSRAPPRKSQEPVDVLNDIGNMLANLTDELDAMLEEEKRQGLTDE
uniref:SAM domain-containing protein n=1 Tax=Clastoptera arizonana TaxID=38151 RepID=A0A1B6DRJ2_9HEMI